MMMILIHLGLSSVKFEADLSEEWLVGYSLNLKFMEKRSRIGKNVTFYRWRRFGYLPSSVQ